MTCDCIQENEITPRSIIFHCSTSHQSVFSPSRTSRNANDVTMCGQMKAKIIKRPPKRLFFLFAPPPLFFFSWAISSVVRKKGWSKSWNRKKLVTPLTREARGERRGAGRKLVCGWVAWRGEGRGEMSLRQPKERRRREGGREGGRGDYAGGKKNFTEESEGIFRCMLNNCFFIIIIKAHYFCYPTNNDLLIRNV